MSEVVPLEAVAETVEKVQMSAFAEAIYKMKYAMVKDDGTTEEWPETAQRVTQNVMGALGYRESDVEYIRVLSYINERKFMPGGRYLYASGRPLHQTQNCALYFAEDSREGWSDVLKKVSMSLMTGAGVGVVYSKVRESGSVIHKTGGFASGPISLMSMVNEVGRHVMQGGSRRSAIWAGLHWNHSDCEAFIKAKNWSKEVRELKEKDFNFPGTLDMTNISVILDDDFFSAFENENDSSHELAHKIYRMTIKQMARTAEPGFSIDVGKNAGEHGRNAPVTGGTHVLTGDGYQQVGDIVDQPISLWTGKQWAKDVVFSKTMEDAPIVSVQMSGGRTIRCEPTHEFLVERYEGAGQTRRLNRIDRVAAENLSHGDQLHVSLVENSWWDIGRDDDAYALGYIYGDGSFTKGGGADVTFCSPESRECVGTVARATRVSSVTENDGRGYTRAYFKVDHDYFDGRSKSVFPTEMYTAEDYEQASFLAGLFDADGNWEPTNHRIRLASKHPEFLRGVARLLEHFSILAGVSKAGKSTYGQSQGWQLVVMGDYIHDFKRLIPTERLSFKDYREDYVSYRRSALKVLSVTADGFEDVYCADVKVPEHSFMAEGVIISNCTEVTTTEDSDICNLGSINLGRIEDIEELEDVVKYSTLFLLAGTVYSDLPHDEIYRTREKNRRLGLGLMGVHEWLLQREKPYAPDQELGEWLDVYATSGDHAAAWAVEHGLSIPVKTRAIAPTGTIGIIAETTTGIEPLYAVAFKRRYLDGTKWKFQYVVDPTAHRIIESGVDPKNIEDAYTLAYDVERRVAFQAWMQTYVDHGISSTINIPYPIRNLKELDQFGDMLYSYLPKLRGITVFPDGSRGGQPLTVTTYENAISHKGVVFEEDPSRCVGGACGV